MQNRLEIKKKKRPQDQPPKWIVRVLELYCEPTLLEGIQGDLLEIYLCNINSRGGRYARLIYFWQALGFLRLKFRKKPSNYSNMGSIWTNYFITSYRSLKRHKVYFFINMIGLVLAITCSLYAMIFISDEMAFNSHYKDNDQIYRLHKRYINVPEGIDHLTAETSGMMGPTMFEEYPEVEKFTRLLAWWDDEVATVGDKNYALNDIYFVDSSFFEIFNIDLIAGDPRSALVNPSSIVLTESLARNIFEDENPIGETLIGINEIPLTVTGIVKDPIRQSSFQYKSLISWTTTTPGIGPLQYRWMNNWLAQGITTFVVLSNGTDPSVLVDKLPDMMQRHFPERADQYFLRLQAFEDMYLFSDQIRNNEQLKFGSARFLYILGFTGFLIFLIASINYINIAISRVSQNYREVGVRKVLGSTRYQLIARFINESFITAFTASLISVILLASVIPYLNILTSRDIPFTSLLTIESIGFIILFCIFLSLIVGIYPAYLQSSSSLLAILKNNTQIKGSGWLRKGLLILQYSISIGLIACTIAINQQTEFLSNKSLGFNEDQLLVLDINNEVGQKAEVLESELLKHPNIQNISICRNAIGGGSYSTTVIPDDYVEELNVRIFAVDQEFFETYQLKTAEGRTYLKGSVADSNNLIVNRSFLDYTGWKTIEGKRLKFGADGDSYPVIGVVEDFHYQPVSTSVIEPMVFYLNLQQNYYATLRLGNGDIHETISYIESVWNDLSTRTPLTQHFVDQYFQDAYERERQLLETSSIYTFISILLCVLGLYGLTALILQQRMKEISIRKVLGAGVETLVKMINKQFVIVFIIGIIVSVPITYYLMKKWLDQFAYHIDLDPSPFIYAGVLTVVSSLVVISILTIRASFINPARTLSQE